jgi:hypothetical protein
VPADGHCQAERIVAGVRFVALLKYDALAPRAVTVSRSRTHSPPGGGSLGGVMPLRVTVTVQAGPAHTLTVTEIPGVKKQVLLRD